MSRENGNSKNGFEPLYKPVMNEVIQKIHDGVYRPGRKIASVRELADEYCVSRQVAHSALHKLVELNYLYAEPKRGLFVNPALRPGMFYRIALYVNEKNPMRNAHLMYKIYEICLEKNCDVILGSNYQTNDSISSFLKRDTRFDAILLHGIVDEKLLKEVRNFHVPYLVLGNYDISPEHPQVRIEVKPNVRAVLAAEFSAFKGKKIAALFGKADNVGLELEAGFYEAVKASGAETSPDMVKRCLIDGYTECLELFSAHRPDVLLVLEALRPGYRKYCQLKKPSVLPYAIGTVYSKDMVQMEDEFVDRLIFLNSDFTEKAVDGVRRFLERIRQEQET